MKRDQRARMPDGLIRIDRRNHIFQLIYISSTSTFIFYSAPDGTGIDVKNIGDAGAELSKMFRRYLG